MRRDLRWGCGLVDRNPGVNFDDRAADVRLRAGGALTTMTAMRVYLGSDHAGFELKQAIIDHLRDTGHEPIDCGAYTYDAEDDYPAFCIAAADKTVADPGSLGIVLGGSGNGEQIAANKVPGARCALGVERGDRHAGPPAQQRAGDRHRRRACIPSRDALAIVDAFLTTRSGRKPNGTNVASTSWPTTRLTHVAPPVPGAPA